MTELGAVFARLGLEQYLDAFIVEGFDTWETVLDIQETDLDALNVKLGHRRKLQREIANQRGLLQERPIGSPTTEASNEALKTSESSPTPTIQSDRPHGETKRKYRRHPKPDKNAPERPPSAYVIFSNLVREEVRGENLSFTEIAKRVGDRWQKLSAAEKEPFESQANAAKEKFNAEHAQYKKTDAYKEYTQYVADFKAKHSVSTSDGKRPKLEHESSGGSGSSKTNEAVLDSRPHVSSVHTRDISIGSLSSTSFHGDLPSPQGGNTGLPPSMTGYSVSAHLSRISSSLTMHSPPEKHDRRDARVPHAILVHASLAGQAQQIRGDLPELHSRTGQLSLAPASHGMNLPSGDSGFGGRTAPVFPPPLPQHPTNSSVSSVAYSDSSSNSNPGPITPADEPWRFQPPDAKGKSSEWPRLYNPLPANNYSTSMNQLPPLQPSDRVPDLSRDPNQRTLPLPAPSSPHDLKTLYRGPPRHPASLAPSESSVGSPSEPRDEMRSPLETSENDAANALAVLAYTGR